MPIKDPEKRAAYMRQYNVTHRRSAKSRRRQYKKAGGVIIAEKDAVPEEIQETPDGRRYLFYWEIVPESY